MRAQQFGLRHKWGLAFCTEGFDNELLQYRYPFAFNACSLGVPFGAPPHPLYSCQ
jgi:hypothetical protein